MGFLLSLFFPLGVLPVVAEPAFSIADFVTCESAEMKAPNHWQGPKKVFQTSDDKFYAWIELRDVSGSHPVEMKLFRPDGTYYGQELQITHETNGVAGWWRMAAWWKIKGDGPAQTPGRWKLDLLIDGALQRSIYFDINPEKPELAAHSLTNITSPVAVAQEIPHPALAGREAKMCIIEASSDLTHWTPVQTNALGTGTMAENGQVRLAPCDGYLGLYVVEVFSNLNWRPIQTVDLANVPPLAASSMALGPTQFYRGVIR